MSKSVMEVVKEMRRHIDGDGPVGPGTPAMFTEACQPGDRICQGDVEITMVVRVPSTHKPRTSTLTNIVHGEAGAETHSIDDPSKVRIYDHADWTAESLDGPVVEVIEPTGISHTGAGRHGHVGLCPGVYAISYPRVWESEQAAERRNRD